MTDLNQASITARNVASIRYAQSFDAAFGTRGPDALSGGFLPLTSRMFAGPLRFIARAYLRAYIPGMYEWIYARTRHYDTLVLEAIEEGVTQIVILGAGYDTRGVRFREQLDAVGGMVFELDHPATQQDKQQRAQGLDTSRITFVPIDFETTSVAEALEPTGFDPTQPALFFYEGVLMYLDEDGVKRTLTQVRQVAAPGSRLSFDFCTERSTRGEDTSLGAQETYAHVRKKGEPLRWGAEPEQIPALLEAFELQTERVWQPEHFEEAYLTDARGQVHRMTGHNNAVIARWS